MCLGLRLSCTPFVGRVLVDFYLSVGLIYRDSREILLLYLLLGSTSKVLFFAWIVASGRFPDDSTLDPGHFFKPFHFVVSYLRNAGIVIFSIEISSLLE